MEGAIPFKNQQRLKEEIRRELLAAAKSGDVMTRSTLRMLLAEIERKEIELGKKEEGLADQEIGEVALREIRKRADAAEQYEKGGRQELSQQERAEAEILKKYAPQQLTEGEVRDVVIQTIEEIGVQGPQETGVVMKAVMPKVQGRADGSLVSKVVQEYLKSL